MAHVEITASDIRLVQFHLSGWIGRKAKVKGNMLPLTMNLLTISLSSFIASLSNLRVETTSHTKKRKSIKRLKRWRLALKPFFGMFHYFYYAFFAPPLIV